MLLYSKKFGIEALEAWISPLRQHGESNERPNKRIGWLVRSSKDWSSLKCHVTILISVEITSTHHCQDIHYSHKIKFTFYSEQIKICNEHWRNLNQYGSKASPVGLFSIQFLKILWEKTHSFNEWKINIAIWISYQISLQLMDFIKGVIINIQIHSTFYRRQDSRLYQLEMKRKIQVVFEPKSGTKYLDFI